MLGVAACYRLQDDDYLYTVQPGHQSHEAENVSVAGSLQSSGDFNELAKESCPGLQRCHTGKAEGDPLTENMVSAQGGEGDKRMRRVDHSYKYNQ